MKNITRGASCLFICLVMMSQLVVSKLYAQQAREGTLAVWSQAQGSEYPVLLSRQTEQGWSEPVKLSSNNRLNLVPSITTDQQGEHWVVWSSVDGNDTALLYKKTRDGVWSEEKKVETGFSSNTAPSIVVDHNNVLWLSWAAFDGQDDEIYTTFWNGSAFEPPVAVSGNSVPDILPIMSFDSATATLAVQWQGYADGSYVSFNSTYSEGKWSMPVRNQESEQEQPVTQNLSHGVVPTQNVQTETVDVELPNFLLSQPSLSLHVKGKIIQSLPARLLQVESE